jgi:ABC-type transport system involved in multi-copper enzyme maturation permease subunit
MLAAAIKKDLRLLVHDRTAFVSLFVMPVVFIAIFGVFFGDGDGGGGPGKRNLQVWAADTPRNKAVLAAIDASKLFDVARMTTPDDARRGVAAEAAVAALILPADFDPANGHPAELAIDEALSPQIRMPVEGALTGIITRVVFPPPPGADQPVLVAKTPPGIDRALDNVDAFQLTVPGNSVLFGFFLALTVGLAFTEERRTGTWRRILAAPVSRARVLGAKLASYLIVGLVQFTFLFGVGAGVFGMRIGGSIFALVLLTVGVVSCAVSFGLLIASFGGTPKRIGSLGSMCLLVMGLVGGAMVPRAVMPPAMQTVGLFVPHGWALDGYFTLLVRDGATIVDVAPQIAAVFGFAAAFATIGVWRFRFES